MYFNKFSRRLFLGTGSKFLAIPFLPSLVSSRAFSQASANDTFYIQLITTHGHMHEHFFPETKYRPTTNFVGDSTVYYRKLTEQKALMIADGKTKISEGIGNIFDPYLDKISVIDHLALPSSEHEHNFSHATAAASLNANATYCNSIDVLLAESGKVYATPPQIPILMLRPSRDNAYPYNLGVSFKNKNYANYPYIETTLGAWNQIFPGASLDADQQAADRARKKKITDLVLQDYKSVLASGRLSADDKKLFTDYVDYINDISASLQSTLLECPVVKEDARQSVGISYNANNNAVLGNETLDQKINNHIDLIVAAIACGVTKIASLYLSCGYYNGAIREGYDELHGPIGHSIDDATWPELNRQTVAWRAEKFARLVQKLDSLNLPSGGTLLDRGVAYYGNEYGGVLHGLGRMHIMTAGGAGGKLRTGYFIDYRHSGDGNNQARPYNNFLVTLCNVFGLQPSDYEKAGIAGFGQPYQWIDHHWRDQVGGFAPFSSDAEKRKPLPYYFIG